MVSDNAVRRQAQSNSIQLSSTPSKTGPSSVPPSVLLFPAGASAADLGFDFSKLVSPIPGGSSRPFDPTRPFNLVELIDSAGKAYKASNSEASRLTLKVFPAACWNTLETLQKRVRDGVGKNPLLAACIEYGVDHLSSQPMVREYIDLRGRSSDARQDLDPAVKDQLAEFLDGFVPVCDLRKRAGWVTPNLPHGISEKLSTFSESTGIRKTPLAIWCITQALAVQPSQVNGGVGLNDGYRKQMEKYLVQVAHDLEIATRMARAIMNEFGV